MPIPFSNGFQYLDWDHNNCPSCKKLGKCDIQDALEEGTITGKVSQEIWDRMGHDEGRFTWPCLEHDPPFRNVENGKIIRGVK